LPVLDDERIDNTAIVKLKWRRRRKNRKVSGSSIARHIDVGAWTVDRYGSQRPVTGGGGVLIE
jgi:hypothetical protein